jgi:6-phosphofructokinase 1
MILIPEKPIVLDQVTEVLRRRSRRGRTYSMVVAAEGARVSTEGEQAHVVLASQKTDEFGHVRHGGIAQVLAGEIEKRTGMETRYVILGHTQRGGSPTAFDRILATRFGVAAVEMVEQGRFGRMVALRGRDISSVPFSDALATRTVDDELYDVAATFFG